MPTLTLRGLSKTYTGAVNVTALKDATVTITQGEYVVIEGPSGSGKSTMLNQIALLDMPSGGEYLIDGIDTTALTDVQRSRLRSSTFSFIFQSFHLLEGRTVLDNVALGTLYRGLALWRRRELAREALGFVGLEHKAFQNAATLSGGERQRVAIARAVASRVPILVADEPTGNLDQANGQQVMDTLEALNATGTTVILVTHDPVVAARARRRLHVLDGVLSDNTAAASSNTAPHTPSILHLNLAHESTPSDAHKPSREVTSAASGITSETSDDITLEGHDSQVRLKDALIDAWKGLWAKPQRTVALIASVALGVGLALTTTGLAQTAQYQVSDIFDSQRNQRVSLLSNATEGSAPAQQSATRESLERLRHVAGVEDVLLAITHEQHSVLPIPETPAPEQVTIQYDVVGLIDGQIPRKIVTLDDRGPNIDTILPGQVIVGEQVAQEMNLGPLAASPSVWIDGQPMNVVGVLKDAGLQIGLLRAVIMRESDAATFSAQRYSLADLKVMPGAAQQVAEQAPIAWVPSAPELIQVNAPPDPTGLRDSIESNVQTMLITLTGVALLAAVLSMTNSMTTAVFQRIGEFGLRRAIGARRIHMTSLVMSESIAIGIMGGVVGIYGSILIILGVTLARQWQPVIDPIMIPIGLLGGIAVGVIGGLVATRRASRIQPSDALRA